LTYDNSRSLGFVAGREYLTEAPNHRHRQEETMENQQVFDISWWKEPLGVQRTIILLSRSSSCVGPCRSARHLAGMACIVVVFTSCPATGRSAGVLLLVRVQYHSILVAAMASHVRTCTLQRRGALPCSYHVQCCQRSNV